MFGRLPRPQVRRYRVAAAILPILGAVFFLHSCGFIAALFEGEGKGLGDPFAYLLSIRYEYTGYGQVDSARRVRFWVMPLDGSGNVKENPGDPSGPPLREELSADSPYGVVSAVVPYGTYAVLAFYDADGNGSINIGESYVIYDDRSFADGFFQQIPVTGGTTIELRFGDMFRWHVIYVFHPREGETVYGTEEKHPIPVTIACLDDNPASIAARVNGQTLPAPALHPDGYWLTSMLEIQLNGGMSGSNLIEVELRDALGNVIDTYKVQFYFMPY